jgi:hypothetical protein
MFRVKSSWSSSFAIFKIHISIQLISLLYKVVGNIFYYTLIFKFYNGITLKTSNLCLQNGKFQTTYTLLWTYIFMDIWLVSWTSYFEGVDLLFTWTLSTIKLFHHPFLFTHVVGNATNIWMLMLLLLLLQSRS